MLLYLCLLCLNSQFASPKKNPQITAKAIQEPDSRTHNLKSAALLLIQSNSSAPLFNFVSSNPASNRRRTYIQSNSVALQLLLYDSAVFLFCHSKSMDPPTIFRNLLKNFTKVNCQKMIIHV